MRNLLKKWFLEIKLVWYKWRARRAWETVQRMDCKYYMTRDELMNHQKRCFNIYV